MPPPPPPPPGMAQAQQASGQGGLPPPPPPPPPMSKTVQFEVGSPINNGNADDDLDFAKELLDGANGGMGGGAPMLEHSRIED
jgi:hypothetical protein